MCNKAIAKYIRRAKKVHYGDRETKKHFIADLQDSLLCFSEEHPDCSYTDLVEKFGSPCEIRESFFKFPAKELKKRNIILYRIIIICSILIIIAALTVTIHHVLINYEYSQGYAIKRITDSSHPEPDMEPQQTPIEVYIFD